MEIDALLEKQKNVLRYWRASIKNKQLLDFKVLETQYYDHQIEKSILQSGQISEGKTKELFKKNKRLRLTIKKESPLTEENKVEEEYILPVMIAPFLYKKKHEQGAYKHTEKKRFAHPAWIYAYLDFEGNIFSFYPCLLPPWIAREYLNPVYKHDSSLIIGEMSDYDSFLDQKSLIDLDSSSEEDPTKKPSKIYWKSLYQFTVQMLEKVSPNLANLLQDNGYFESEKSLLIPANDTTIKNYSVNLLKLLDSLESEDKKYSPLLSRYLNLSKSPDKPPLSTLE